MVSNCINTEKCKSVTGPCWTLLYVRVDNVEVHTLVGYRTRVEFDTVPRKTIQIDTIAVFDTIRTSL